MDFSLQYNKVAGLKKKKRAPQGILQSGLQWAVIPLGKRFTTTCTNNLPSETQMGSQEERDPQKHRRTLIDT